MRLLRTLTLAFALALLGAPLAHGKAHVRIVGGNATAISSTPWQVGLLYAGTASTFDAQFCGGTIRDSLTIVTAAHCVDGYPASTFDVLAGTATLGNTSGQRIRVADIDVHPDYDSTNNSNDAALLTLSAPITTTAAAALPPITPTGALAIDAPSDNLLTSGWGSTLGYAPGTASPPTSFPTGLRSVTVPFVTDLTCGGAYGSGIVAPLMLCAGTEGKDSCQGDSGGPIAYNNGGAWTLAGIVSWGAGCGAAGYPGVYTEIASASVQGFVTGAVTEQEAEPPADDSADDDSSSDAEDDTDPVISLIRKQCTRRTCNLLLSIDDGGEIDSVRAALSSKLKACSAKAKAKGHCTRKRKLKARSSGQDDGLYTLTATKLKSGRHVITITATDDAQNSATRRFAIKSR